MADLKALKNKTIITVAPTGAWPKKKDNPNVPMTPEEIAEDVYECWKAGAAVAHLHMRDDEGNGIMDPVRFKKTVELIKAHEDCDIVLNLTTSGDIHADDDIRVAHVEELKPEMASYDCGSMNWLNSGLFINSPAFLERCGLSFQEWGVKPEIEAFDPGMIANAAYYIKKGVLKTPVHFQFCMGCANGITGTMKNLVFMKEEAEKLVGAQNFTWSCFGVGHSAMEMLYGAVALGGHIRVGMEDNVLFAKGQLAESNAQFVKRAVEAVKLFGREVATPDEARQLLSLPPYNTAE
ncbi:MAG: 3-keto-5-aminohexanoate cleavage protein [Lachnospiraceae bacterium]|nr:3-keto-5-aminohexanoate cleavage protein [Lachnospiraceae bacterium]